VRQQSNGSPEEKWCQELFRIHPRLIEAGRAVCRGKANAAYADLTEAMPPPNEQYFFDGVHCNDAGQRKVAEILAEKLKTSGLLKHTAQRQAR